MIMGEPGEWFDLTHHPEPVEGHVEAPFNGRGCTRLRRVNPSPLQRFDSGLEDRPPTGGGVAVLFVKELLGRQLGSNRAMESKFLGREVISKPRCPFCGLLVERPRDLRRTQMPTGACKCGAVYVLDVTGHNLGAAMMEALLYACGGDWDLAGSLRRETDYLDDQLKNYDDQTHLIIHRGIYQGRRIAGTLFFISLRKPVQSPKKNEVVMKQNAPASRRNGITKGLFGKQDAEALVNAYDLEPLLGMAEEDKKITRDLKRLLYSGDKLLRWRAAEALGKVTSVIAQRDHGTVARLLQGFFTSLTDTASSSWGALNAIGEIIGREPEQFSGYLPQLLQLSRDRSLLADVLRALCKIGSARPDLLRSAPFRVTALLQDPDPEIRGYAAILLGNVGVHEAKTELEKLLDDRSEVETYRDGYLEKKTVGQLASESLKRL
jgi:hypothetical protein